MTGEMSKSEVTRDAYPLHFAAADECGGTVEPYDTYQGPYVYVPGKGRFWLNSDDGVIGQWYSEATHELGYGFFCDCAEDVPAEALRYLIDFGGCDAELIDAQEDIHRLAEIGEA